MEKQDLTSSKYNTPFTCLINCHECFNDNIKSYMFYLILEKN